MILFFYSKSVPETILCLCHHIRRTSNLGPGPSLDLQILVLTLLIGPNLVGFLPKDGDQVQSLKHFNIQES
jgi:hypothetical protein